METTMLRFAAAAAAALATTAAAQGSVPAAPAMARATQII